MSKLLIGGNVLKGPFWIILKQVYASLYGLDNEDMAMVSAEKVYCCHPLTVYIMIVTQTNAWPVFSRSSKMQQWEAYLPSVWAGYKITQ
jgi:hypothetical protein